MRPEAFFLCALVSASLVGTDICEAQQTTPLPPYYPNQLQGGLTPFVPNPLQSGITTFASSGLTSGITEINQNPLAENAPVRIQPFSQGGLSTVPGGDNSTQITNSTNATSSTSGRGLSNSRR